MGSSLVAVPEAIPHCHLEGTAHPGVVDWLFVYASNCLPFALCSHLAVLGQNSPSVDLRSDRCTHSQLCVALAFPQQHQYQVSFEVDHGISSVHLFEIRHRLRGTMDQRAPARAEAIPRRAVVACPAMNS